MDQPIQNAPKKRGRKKKNPEASMQPGFPFPVGGITLKSEEQTKSLTPEQKEWISDRQNKINKIFVEVDKFDEHILSEDMAEKIFTRFLNHRYSNYLERTHNKNIKYKKIYEKIINGTAEPDEIIEWRDVITPECAEKLCKIIDHLLMSGSLTENEVSIFDRCVYLLKSYYVERNNLIINSIDSEYHRAHTYFPGPDTYAYKIFIGEDEISISTMVYKLSQN